VAKFQRRMYRGNIPTFRTGSQLACEWPQIHARSSRGLLVRRALRHHKAASIRWRDAAHLRVSVPEGWVESVGKAIGTYRRRCAMVSTAFLICSISSEVSFSIPTREFRAALVRINSSSFA